MYESEAFRQPYLTSNNPCSCRTREKPEKYWEGCRLWKYSEVIGSHAKICHELRIELMKKAWAENKWDKRGSRQSSEVRNLRIS